MQISPSDLGHRTQTRLPPLDNVKAMSGSAGGETLMTSCGPQHTLEIEDQATTVGSSLSEASEDLFGDQLDDDVFVPEVESDEEEEGAQEESEFSLDGRLASIKRWRRFQALQQETGTGTSMAVSSIVPASVCDTPLPAHLDTQVPPLSAQALTQAHAVDHCCSMPVEVQLTFPPGLGELQRTRPEREFPPPPGLSCAAAPMQASVPLPTPSQISFNLLNMSASLLSQSSVPGLEGRIRLLSQHALGLDALEALLEPEPDDPEWHLLALVGKEFLAGFSTYAFFPEDCDDGSSGLIMSIHHVVAAKVFRGMGHGRTMLEDLLARARSANAWAVKLFSKPTAVGFYERMGFNLAGYENEDGDHLMEVRLLQ